MIELENIGFAYPGQPAFMENLSTAFPEGEITSIIGPNGCGKSTLLKIACNLVTPQRGRVLHGGRDVRTIPARELAREVALLHQINTPPSVTVEDLAAYGRYPHQKYGQALTKEDREIISRALAVTKADAYRDKNIGRLSGGQRQRAYIAMALAQDTSTIFLDEPTTFLDINIRYEIMDLAKALRARGKTIIMVLHDLSLALEYSQRIILMEKGRIVSQGTPEALCASHLVDDVFHIRTHCFKEGEKTLYCFSKG